MVAAFFAASHAFADEYEGTFIIMDDHDGPLPAGREHEVHARAECAADFVRTNPEAPADAIPIHVGLKGFKDVPPLGLREMAAWRIFAFTLKQLDEVDAELQRRREAAQAKPEPSAPWPGERAMQPQPEAFAPTGFSPR